MATVTSNQVGLTPAGYGLAGSLKVWWGTYSVASALSANDLVSICKLPKGSIILGGHIATDDIDTGTETLDIDVGWTANGGGSATVMTADGTTWTNAGSTANPDGFVNGGVFTGDAITDLVPAGSNLRPFVISPKYFSEETLVQAKIIAAANAGGTGTITVVLFGVLL